MGRGCSPVVSRGGILVESEGSEGEGVPTPGAPGSMDDLEKGKRTRTTCRLSWISLRRGIRVDLDEPDAAAAAAEAEVEAEAGSPCCGS